MKTPISGTLKVNNQVHAVARPPRNNLIAACRVSRNRVEVDLSGRLGDLSGVEGFDVSLQVDDSTFQRFADGLTKVFKGDASALLSGAQQ